MADMTKIQAARAAEFEAAQAKARDSFEAYWAGSASASVMRDYRSGRAVDAKRRRKPRGGLRIVKQA